MLRGPALAGLFLIGGGAAAETDDGTFAVDVGGRVHVEAGTSSSEPALAERFEFENGIDWRRARLLLEGRFLDRLTFKIEHDIANGDLLPTEVFLEATQGQGRASVRVGHFKEPFSLSILQSSNHYPFIARPVAATALAPGRNLGLMIHDRLAGDRVAWAVGAFRDSDGYDVRPGSDWSLSGRVTGLARDGEVDAQLLLHLGLGLAHREPAGDTMWPADGVRPRPLPSRVDSGRLAADTLQLAGAELALARRSFWLQGELLAARVDLLAASRTLRFDAQYLEAGWFLTGERRPYSRSTRTFTRLSPRAPVPKGRGAWELAARWDRIDLSDGAGPGGRQQSLTLALNWYLRSNLRVLTNYVSTNADGAGSVEHLGLLLNLDF